MIQITRWSPDHCICVLEYSWDDSVPQDQRVHTAASTVTQCPAHIGLNVTNHYATVLEENQRKNKTYGAILINLPALTQTIVNPDGTTSTILKNGVTFDYSFDVSRNLTITFGGATTLQKAALQTWCDTNLGVGKVVVK